MVGVAYRTLTVQVPPGASGVVNEQVVPVMLYKPPILIVRVSAVICNGTVALVFVSVTTLVTGARGVGMVKVRVRTPKTVLSVPLVAEVKASVPAFTVNVTVLLVPPGVVTLTVLAVRAAVARPSMAILKSPPKPPKNETLQIRIEEEIRSRLEEYAEFIDASESYVVTEALKLVFRKDNEFKTWIENRSDNGHESKKEADSLFDTAKEASGIKYERLAHAAQPAATVEKKLAGALAAGDQKSR